MLDWQSLVLSLLAVGLLVVLLRWAFSGPGSSLVERKPEAGHPDEYGLLVSIAAPGTYIEGEVLRQRLETAGLRATLISTADGPRIMVFREDEARARAVLAR